MKRLLLLALLVIPLQLARGYQPTEEPQTVHVIGPVAIYNPLSISPRGVYYYDLKSREHRVGGEIILLNFYRLEGFFGLSTDINNVRGANQTVGANLALPNPLQSMLSLADIHPSLSAGWNMQRAETVVALKVGISL